MAEWRENDAQWYEERMLHCATCGRMIAKRYLSEDIADRVRMFCGEGCLELYGDYVLVERGADYRSREDVGETYEELMVR